MHLFGFGRSARYPQLCNPCFRQMEQHRGGAEIPVTVLVADVRGSTGMAERSSAADFSSLLARFYAQVTEAVREEGGIIDKFLGDGVMTLPAFLHRQAARPAGPERGAAHPARCRAADRGGVNTGQAFTGFVGPTAEVAGFSAVGDAVNVAHRLGEAAGPGELMVGGDELKLDEAPVAQSGELWEMRELQVKGRDQLVKAWSLRLEPAAVA